eukprot:TRINITY_DN4746_c0_g1_i2.p1 TRINITY_DN4746_c0_g1~~TRINITY_DN4746_c0_g1_i2.p1  ORF type:complete len:267 (+),score=24.41 TRINITY_DN4746_c0_g1_i2:475-1275(+)
MTDLVTPNIRKKKKLFSVRYARNEDTYSCWLSGSHLPKVNWFQRIVYLHFYLLLPSQSLTSMKERGNKELVADLQTVKISDFGSAQRPSEVEISPNVASRYYRPPEVILGFLYGYPLDMWALGCIVFELFTGNVMFPGEDNRDMLHVMQLMKGGIPRKMVKHAEYKAEYFDENNKFLRTEVAAVTKAVVLTPKTYTHHTTHLKQVLDKAMGQAPDTNQKTLLSNMRDFIDKATALDPSMRMTADEATRHPFVVGMITNTIPDPSTS